LTKIRLDFLLLKKLVSHSNSHSNSQSVKQSVKQSF